MYIIILVVILFQDDLELSLIWIYNLDITVWLIVYDFQLK